MGRRRVSLEQSSALTPASTQRPIGPTESVPYAPFPFTDYDAGVCRIRGSRHPSASFSAAMRLRPARLTRRSPKPLLERLDAQALTVGEQINKVANVGVWHQFVRLMPVSEGSTAVS
jgi:hypothetical protein